MSGVAVAVTCLVSAACLLDGEGRGFPPSITAHPTVLCATEPTWVAWSCPTIENEDGSTRLLCDTVNVAQTTGDVFGPFTTQSDSTTASFTRDTTVQITTVYRDESRSASESFNVIGNLEEESLPYTFEHRCEGRRSVWEPVALSDDYSSCIEIVAVINNSGHRIEISTADARSLSMDNGDVDTEILVGPASVMFATTVLPPNPNRCGDTDTVEMDDNLEISVIARCDTSLPGCAAL